MPNNQTMRAWICRGYGGPEVLALEERPRPVPRENEILVKVHATTVSSGDVRIRSQKLPRGFGMLGRLVFGLRRPRQPILGTELAGVVVEIGGKVDGYAIGDEVIAFPGGAMGCHAEYRAISVRKPIARKPARLSFEEAASLSFGGTTALHFLRKAKLREGERILVIGASGAVGSAMVQLASDRGANVTGVTSTANVELVRSLGAHEVIDYKLDDFRKLGQTYDIIADTVGASSFKECLPLLRENGRYLSIAGDLLSMLARPVGTRRSIGGPAAERAEDVRELAQLAEAGRLKPVIDSVWGFDQLMDAHARAETGRKRGSVIVSMQL
jgi:NADPH:quinone reductase-like Zn-dependent oxidoreductase